jgi:hypothetical protein
MLVNSKGLYASVNYVAVIRSKFKSTNEFLKSSKDSKSYLSTYFLSLYLVHSSSVNQFRLMDKYGVTLRFDLVLYLFVLFCSSGVAR